MTAMVKLKVVWKKTLIQARSYPPRLIPAFVAGFNAIANHIYLIIFPVLLDLLLWLGPLVRVKNLVQPAIEETIKQMSGLYPADYLALMESSKQSFIQFFEHFNLLFALRTFPIGIPSLMVGIAPINNPLGNSPIIEMTTMNQAWSVIITCIAFGLVMGCLFFSLVAKVVAGNKMHWDVNVYLLQLKNAFFLMLGLLVLGVLLSIPTLLLMSLMVSFLPSLGSLPIMIIGVFLVWMILPMVFAVHGIFMGQTNIWKSLANSMHLVRRYLPGTGLFFLVAVLLGQGLDLLWSTPSSGEWISLIGIFGHAFISSGVLAASFVYYFKGMEYMQEKIRRDSAKIEMPAHIGN